MWNLSVSGDLSGRYLSTDVAVRPDHIVNWLFFNGLDECSFGRTEKTMM